MKKKHIIGLGTLLLVLLLGSFTTSYANSYREFTETEIKNILYKAWMNGNHSENDILNVISTFENDGNITTVVNSLNNTSNCFITFDTGTTGYNNCYIACYDSNSNTHPYFYNGRIFFKNRPSGTLYKMFYNGTFTSSTTINFSNENRTDYIYYGDNVYNSSSGTTVTHAGNTYTPSTFFDEWYYQDAMPFIFIAKPSDTYASVWSYDDVPFYNASGEDLYIGQLFVPDGTIMEENNLNFYYRFGTWNHRYLPDGCYYLNYFSNIDDVVVYDVYLSKQFIYQNTLYDLTISDKSVEPYNLASIFFYIRNNYTVISNGVLDTSSTFSGDYKEQYDNEIQNEQDINNISEAIIGTILDDSEVDNILHNFDTSGEVAAYFGYHDYTSDNDTAFYRPSLLITSVMESLIDELMRSGDRYIDITLPNGEQERIWARFFTTPDEGRGSAWILFVRWYLIFVTIYLIYRNLLEIGEQFTTFNIHGALNDIDVNRYVFRM